MITRLDLQHFKCFERLILPIAPITLLSGANASGKSSVLQALVLLHQTIREHEWSTRLMLNGNTIRLGVVADVVDEIHGRRSCDIGITNQHAAYQWGFSGERSEMSMGIKWIKIDNYRFENPGRLRHLLPPDIDGTNKAIATCLKQLTYITAERVGPREIYNIEDRQISSVVGPSGEYAVSVLNWGRDKQVLDNLAIPDCPPTLLRQVEARMQYFFPECGITLRQVPQANAVTLGMRTSQGTEFHRPIHVGFGLSQVFPIIVAALSTEKEGVLLIENPEVHLHPAGQALMGSFLAEVATAGIQVIVESHSDHILNGIRRAVKAQRLSSEQVALHFFRPRTDNAPQVETPQIDSAGNIDVWPDGFFDQFDKDMNHFAGWED